MQPNETKPSRTAHRPQLFALAYHPAALLLSLLLLTRAATAQSVIAWGDNSYDQLNAPPEATNVVAVAAGWRHSLALTALGEVVAWGAAAGNGNISTQVVGIAAGGLHSVAVGIDGTVTTWGDNSYGQSTVPGAATNIVAVAAGNFHTLALRSDGKVIAWGKGDLGQTTVPVRCTNITAIAAGGELCLALRSDGACFVWGAGYSARAFRSEWDIMTLAASDWQQVALTPGGRAISRGAEVPIPSTNLIAVACATNYSLGLGADGALTAWGNSALTNLPPDATNLHAVAAGDFHCLAVRETEFAPRIQNPVAYQRRAFAGARLPLAVHAIGQLPISYQWLSNGVPIPDTDTATPGLTAALGSDNVSYQVVVTNALGTTTSAVVKILVQSLKAWGADSYAQSSIPPSLGNTIAVATGERHALALGSNGRVTAWGMTTNVPASVTNIVAIAAGGSGHNLALNSNGVVISWGSTSSPPASARNVVAISAGWAHSLALRADGSAVGWGNDECGQRSVAGFVSNAIAIASGYWHNMVLTAEGRVLTAGLEYPIPASVTNIVAVSAGWEICLALRADGSVVAWGDNRYGQCEVPAAATNVVAITAGYFHNVAERSDGSLIAWGKDYGGSTIFPPGVHGLSMLAAGQEFNLALAGTTSPRFGKAVSEIAVAPSAPALLSLKVLGEFPLAFQWFHDGMPLPNATNRCLVIDQTTAAHAGAYVLVASNRLGEASSAPINLTVRATTGPAPGLTEWREAPYGRQLFYSAGMIPVCAISAGAHHRLALNTDGSIQAWGKNVDGQLMVPAEATNIVAVAAGSDHSLALREDGNVLAWGRNWDGQTNVPVAATNVVAIAAGHSHSLALRADGSVVAWGNNEFGQSAPCFLATEVIAIAAGYYHNLALRADGRVVAWGLNENAPAEATNMIAIAAGAGHSLALRSDGTVLAWGDNRYGQTLVPDTATNIIAIAAGFYHSMALRADGALITWGGEDLQPAAAPRVVPDVASIELGEDYNLVLPATGLPRLGKPLRAVVANPGGLLRLQVAVQTTPSSEFRWYHEGNLIPGATNRTLLLSGVSPATSGNYVLQVSNDSGQVSSQPILVTVGPQPVTQTVAGGWGDNNVGQYTIPTSLTHPRAVAAGSHHGLALQADGSVVAWGKNSDGQTNVPPALGPGIAVAAGGSHNLVLLADGTVVAWGRNWDGQTNVPPALTNVTAIAAGASHSLALSQDGSITAWGSNEYGQTGVPVQATNILAIASAYHHSLALRSDHRVLSWGSQTKVPAEATNVVAIAAGWEHSLALREDGSVVAWGDNSYGQCEVPPGATNLVWITAGYGHSAAKRADGAVFAWGTATRALTNVPAGLRNVTRLAGGENHILGLVEIGPARITDQPESAQVHVGGTVLFNAMASGSEPLLGQWFHDDLPLPGATNRQLSLAGLQPSEAGAYVYVVTNSFSRAQSEPANLELLAGPGLEVFPSTIQLLPGERLRLAPQATGTPPLGFQWRHRNLDLADAPRVHGSQTDTLEVNPADYADEGDYTLVVTNAFGSITGVVARVSVTPVIAWGDNGSGQLAVPPSVTNIVAVSAGEDHSLALRADGSLVAWGDNSFGQATVPEDLPPAVAVSAGGRHSLALLASGRVVAWGDNSRRQTNVPVNLSEVTAIAAGENHSVALLRDGTVRAWGDSWHSQTNVPLTLSNVVAIAAGENYSAALRTNGDIVSWGGFFQTNLVKGIDADSHLMAIRTDDSIAMWGRNYYDQTRVPAAATNVVALAAGGDHSLALRGDGQVVAWGGNYSGQTNVPTWATNLVAVSAGGAHNLALRKQTGTPAVGAQPPQSAKLGESVLLLGGGQSGIIANYQWRLNGKDIPGATNAALFVGNLHWTNAGSYQIAISNALGTTVGPAVIVTVVRTPLVFESAAVAKPAETNVFQTRLQGASGVGPVIIYASSNLFDWVPVFTNSPIIGAIDYTDLEPAGHAERYYRAAEVTLEEPLYFARPKARTTGTTQAMELSLRGLSASGPITIYVSTNLNDWTAIFTNPPTIGPLEYLDFPTPDNSMRFYRASESR